MKYVNNRLLRVQANMQFIKLLSNFVLLCIKTLTYLLTYLITY